MSGGSLNTQVDYRRHHREVAVTTVLRMPTCGAFTPDLPPCGNTWTPRTCRGYDQRSPVDHRCWTWAGWPHICRCMRCGTNQGPL